MGGSDEPGNLIEVTVTQHSMWHFCNYQLWGNWEDYLAYRALSGQIRGQDVIKYKLKMGGKKAKKHLWYNKNLGITLELSVRELAEKFSGEKLYLSHLYRVASGKKASYKGWSVV